MKTLTLHQALTLHQTLTLRRTSFIFVVSTSLLAACSGQPPATVTEEKKASTSTAPRLYDLTTLQREANGRFGFPAKRTLQIAQALYERHKMITYPRTDSRALPEDYMPLVRETLDKYEPAAELDVRVSGEAFLTQPGPAIALRRGIGTGCRRVRGRWFRFLPLPSRCGRRRRG